MRHFQRIDVSEAIVGTTEGHEGCRHAEVDSGAELFRKSLVRAMPLLHVAIAPIKPHYCKTTREATLTHGCTSTKEVPNTTIPCFVFALSQSAVSRISRILQKLKPTVNLFHGSEFECEIMTEEQR